MTTLDSLKKILSAYASANNPGANYFYEFDIVPFNHSINAPDFMRAHFALKDNKELSLQSITEFQLRQIISKWFFERERSKNINLDPSENQEKVESFCRSLQTFTKEKGIFHFQNVNNGDYEYQLGIDYDYLYIEGEEKNFLIYFSAQG
ncbi:hypothetical protein ACM46_08665 [Chryseobacterium angstadtii]|uniref:Uncharacterized protein n=1 Tax=Chryseobacterium angstadtii TaxID=558151 RepID=A0A0J7IEC8_9FLAO|nr:hypothetical protein [Chryseobacterium angstadtii]KMQ64354.1 hypothetical protein ACM46_08665 [Chryseobacterium angstadtii]